MDGIGQKNFTNVDANEAPDGNDKIVSFILISIGSELADPQYLQVTRIDGIIFSYKLGKKSFFGTLDDGNLRYVVGSN